MYDEFYMNLAINEAWKFQLLTYPNPPVGCTILDKYGKILSIATHRRAGEAHAELNAVKSALELLNPTFSTKFDTLQNPNELYEFIIKNHSNLLKGATAYVTLEPCSHQGKTPPCAILLGSLGFKKVVIGTRDSGEHAKDGAKILAKMGVEVKFGVCSDEADLLLEPFWAWSNGNFTFFKIALSINGVASGGVISNLKSRIHSHQLRSLIDLLVIGGNSVRVDRPTLDTRLVQSGKNPDVLIYSRSKNFDKTIKLFGVKNRKVYIENSLKMAFGRRLVMIEGGQNALRNLDTRVKWLLIYSSNSMFDRENIKINLNIRPIYTTMMDGNQLIWAKIM